MEKLDFVILYIVVMMVFGVTASIFYPEQYSFGEEDYGGFDASQFIKEEQVPKSWWDNILDGLGNIWGGLLGIVTFLIACLSFNIPYMPWIIRVALTVPFHIGMVYVIATYIRGGG